MDPLHDISPESLLVSTVSSLGKYCIVIIACPHRTGIIRSKTAEPKVTVIICGTCFTCYMHTTKLYPCTGTFRDNIFHYVGKKIGGAGLDDSSFLRSIIDHYIAVGIQDLCVEDRFDIGAVIGNSCISGCQFQIADALCDSSDSGGSVDIIIDSAIDLCRFSDQSSKSKFLKIFYT